MSAAELKARAADVAVQGVYLVPSEETLKFENPQEELAALISVSRFRPRNQSPC